MKTAILTLQYMVDPVLTEPVDKVLYLIRHFIYNPGFITTEYEEQELSFRGIATRFPTDPQAVVDMINEKLGNAIKRNVPELELNVSTQYTFVDQNNYSLTLSVLYSDGTPFIPDTLVTVDENNISVKYKTL